jgi:hypothetical protein
VPPSRQQVDTNVEDFQAFDVNTVYVLGTDLNLWLEHGPFGASVPPARQQIDGRVKPPTVFGDVRPKYQILTLVYAPPGTNGGQSTSSVTYSSSSSNGTTLSTSNSFKDGTDITASVEGGPISASADFSFSATKTDASSLQSTKSKTFNISLNGPAADGINHGDDLFYLWLNPNLSVAMDPGERLSWGLGVDGANMTIQWVSVSELQNPSSMAPGLKQQLDAAGLTQSDYATILTANPFASGTTTIDPTRYWLYNQSFPYEAPLAPSDPVPTESYTLTDSTTQTSTQTQEVQYGVSVSVEAGIQAPFSAKLKVSDSFQWTNTNSQSQQSQSSQTASVTIGGPAYGYAGPTVLLVYWDSVYSSFMFAFPT